MSLFEEILNSCRRATRMATLALVLTAVSAVAAHAQIQEEALSSQSTTTTPPYALFQYATLTASGNTITASWVPVVTASGTTYENVTLLFNVDASGNLTLATGYPEIVPASVITVSSFKAGKYVGPSTIYSGEMILNVSGPGVTSGGATEWSLATASGADYYTYPATGTWYVGPLTSNPFYARIKAAGITSTAWSYGVAGSTCGCSQWQTNTLIGVSQIGNSLTFVSFTNNGKDSSEPVDTVTYTLSQ